MVSGHGILKSNDENNWVTMNQHQNDTSLDAAYKTHTWKTSHCKEGYRMFRVYMTAPNSNNEYQLRCNGFELYGQLLS